MSHLAHKFLALYSFTFGRCFFSILRGFGNFAILIAMESKSADLKKLQKLVLDIQAVKRNHNIPGSSRHENVLEHSMSVAMMCWKVYEDLKPSLNLEKILKYCLVHDYLERGLEKDVNTYAPEQERQLKKQREAEMLVVLKSEFDDFSSMTKTVEDYENMTDIEARFVWCVDKMQGLILGDIDGWRPYKRIGVTYEQFCDKGDMFMSKCPDFLQETLKQLNEYTRGTFYDQPTENIKGSNPD